MAAKAEHADDRRTRAVALQGKVMGAIAIACSLGLIAGLYVLFKSDALETFRKIDAATASLPGASDRPRPNIDMPVTVPPTIVVRPDRSGDEAEERRPVPEIAPRGQMPARSADPLSSEVSLRPGL
ncbi:hypothetical protein [Afifella marina]|uniref:Uncharacterized protein n=1 Tax=Afifella marina DSM 2698 TaxID=1120955 RepID=A0A1G5MB73_AFIMA|nr:hypothetical protein [Afifella marina]MBK1622799.1 hypothetical protein [Afifella marina DSM 2698]MBK1625794.1 hypothetical protein [Afifella marina]MBK5917617.1 hypothetical protein [Afifella marina]RAI23544.1 hypothetical protein CH311_01295 [Afifella marina DSM 2698]SCZ21619.1 hypothetical protein SAMN03080610_00291 [Afifella marina DSM 2698]